MKKHLVDIYDCDNNLVDTCQESIHITKMIRWEHYSKQNDAFYYSYWYYYDNDLMLMDLILNNTGFSGAHLC